MEDFSRRLTNEQICNLADLIPINKMTKIALKYLEFKEGTIENIKIDHKNNSEEQSRMILRRWANKTPYNQVRKLAHFLYKASDDGDIDPHELIKILQVSRAETTSVTAVKIPKPSAEPVMKMSLAKEALSNGWQGLIALRKRSIGCTDVNWRTEHHLLQQVKDYLKRKQKIEIVEEIFYKSITIETHRRIKLQTPKGIYGAILGKYHGNSSQFRYNFLENQCVLSPVLEFHLLNVFKLAQQSLFTLTVPVEHIECIKGKLMVWHKSKDTRTAREAELIEPGEKPSRLDTVYYKFTQYGLEIFTHRFSQFFITSERCDSFAELLVFVKMERRERLVANFNLYLCSLYNERAEHRQETILKEKDCDRSLVAHKLVIFSGFQYDPTKSYVEINWNPRGQDLWPEYLNRSIDRRLNLNEALDFKDGHICRSAPLQLASAVLVPSEDRTDYEIELDFTVEIAAGLESYTHRSRMLIPFQNELMAVARETGPSTLPTNSQDQAADTDFGEDATGILPLAWTLLRRRLYQPVERVRDREKLVSRPVERLPELEEVEEPKTVKRTTPTLEDVSIPGSTPVELSYALEEAAYSGSSAHTSRRVSKY